MTDVYLYTTRFCPYCIRAKALLKSKGVAFREIPVDGRPDLRQEMTAACKGHTVPQIWINGQHIGGCDELLALEAKGKLDTMLTSP